MPKLVKFLTLDSITYQMNIHYNMDQNIPLMGNLFTWISGSRLFYSLKADADEQDKELQPLLQQ